ncbi:uncharacterized protein LOC141690738 [Apium graveolens]|uniref:uncharacterized protein LOC141690738 n=1 Tax=Apium graveolens TaxID=4045 RepID=UPI003D7B7A43
MQNSQSPVTRVFKGRYFPYDHVLKATKGQIWTAKEELKNGFRWVLGNGNDIVATQDPWLRNKANFKVEQNQLYVGQTGKVPSLFLPGEKRWNIDLIQRNFLKEDADEILKVPIPQRMMTNRVVWANSTNGLFVVGCWNHIGLTYDWSQTEFAPEWLIQKLSTTTNEEKVKICVVLWGIWHWRNKKVWEGKVVTPSFAMDSSFRMLSKWTQARKKHESSTQENVAVTPASRTTKLPAAGVFKVNVDASFYPGTNTFAVGMVLRDSAGTFMGAKNCRFWGEVPVSEVEAVCVRETLSWLKDMHRHNDEVVVESDSQLAIKAIQGHSLNYLEISDIVESCRQLLASLPKVLVSFIRKNANRVAHEVAKIPCLANSYNIFTSPPTCLSEALSLMFRFE